MRNILYLVKDSHPVRADCLVSDQASDREVSIVLLQDGVTHTHLPTRRVYALSDDVIARQVTPAYPLISYADMLRLMFESDAVIAL